MKDTLARHSTPVFTVEQSRQYDKRLIDDVGIPSLVLMENAARGVSDAVERLLDGTSTDARKVVVFCGTGNNGGDGLAVARLLRSTGVIVDVVLCGSLDKLTPDARKQYEIFVSLFGKESVTTVDAPAAMVDAYRNHTVVVDALLGTGSSGAPRGVIADAIAAIRQLGEFGLMIVAIDIPSGLNADEGVDADAAKNCVIAQQTVTMAAAKIGFYQQASKSVTGEVSPVSLGAPVGFEGLGGDHSYLVTREAMRIIVPQHDDTASKFTRGRVLAVCGSRGMTGAAIMAASAALRTGCGLVNVAVPKSERSLVAQAMPELLTVGCSEQEDGAPDLSAWDELQEHIDRADVLLIGSGLRAWPGTAELLRKIIVQVDKPMVIDAGALRALADHTELLARRTSATILTPHSGEIASLVDQPWQEVDRKRLHVARDFARRYPIVIAMKGAPTYTVDQSGTTYVNSTGNSGLATAGSGDVLAGIMAGTLVQMRDQPVQACALAVYLHGLAGDIAACEKTKSGMTATDITEMLPLAYKELGSE